MGILATAARRAHLLATSLWELVTDAAAMVSRTSSSDPHSSYYVIKKGMGKRVEGGESWVWWKGESIVSVAARSKWKGEAKLNTRVTGNSALYSLLLNQEEWRLSQRTYLLYMDLLKGDSTLTLALAFLPSTYPCWPMAYIEWNTNKWTMLLA